MRWRDASKMAKVNRQYVERHFERLDNIAIAACSVKSAAPQILPENDQEDRVSNQTMSASEAADKAGKDPSYTIDQVMAAIPIYRAPLPRRSWIAKFRAKLDPSDRRFDALV